MNYKVIRSDELYHHGIKGQKWGVRRFQNPDGTLTPEGRVHYQRQERTEKGRQTRRTIGSVTSGGISAGTAAAGLVAAVKYDNLSASLVTAGKKALELGGTAALQQHMSTLVSVATVSPYVAAGAAAVSVALGVGAALAKHKKNKARDTLDADDAKKSDPEYKQRRKQSRLQNARTNDKYDTDFMEAVQNSEIFANHDKKALLKEYSKYLDDPEKYWLEEADKLKQA